MDLKTQRELGKLNTKLDALASEVHEFVELESRIEIIVEQRVHEIKTAAYITLVVTSVMLALMLGVLLKTFLG